MRCRISGSFGAHEIPLLVMLFYLSRDVASSAFAGPGSSFKLSRAVSYAGDNVRWGVWLGKLLVVAMNCWKLIRDASSAR